MELGEIRRIMEAGQLSEKEARAFLIASGPFFSEELEHVRLGDKKPPDWDFRVMRTLYTLHCRCDRLQEDVQRLSRPWWRRLWS
jgi:hypothetical protein